MDLSVAAWSLLSIAVYEVRGFTKAVASYVFGLRCATVRAKKPCRASSGKTASTPKPALIVAALQRWFAANARDLPWRATRDPYAIWVSEIMLQQTQVKTVIPYWNRWMRRLPTITSLARARPQTIHKLWEGLGYYTRVRNMQRAARVIVQRHGAEFPTQFAEVLELPGIGPYTAGAICSIAFNQPAPILDGNVMRVLARIYALRGDPREKRNNARLWQLAEELVRNASTDGTGDSCPQASGPCSTLNQSLMELGALICTPANPKCELCPVVAFCMAARKGLTESIPANKPRPTVTRRRFHAFVLSRRNQFLVRQRPEGVVNAHLWEFPNIEITAGDGKVERNARELFGFVPEEIKSLCRINHSITRYRISLEVHRATTPESSVRHSAEGRWLTIPELRRLPFASAHKKILDRLAAAKVAADESRHPH